MNLTKTISSIIESGRRIIKVYRHGKIDVRTAYESAPFGYDGSPIENMKAIYSQTSMGGNPVIIGYINKNQSVEPGETRMYSLDADGNVVMFIKCTADGEMYLGGSDDNLVRFSKLKEVVDEIQQDIADLKEAFTTWTPVTQDGGAALKAASATWSATPLQKSIDDAKIEELKTL